MTTRSMSQQELERLLKESEEIARDWDTYDQFRQNREAILHAQILQEGLN